MKKALGVDIGGTKIAVAIIDEKGDITHRIDAKTDITSAETVFQTVVNTINQVLIETATTIDDYEGIGMGVPGKVDAINGIAVFQNNIPWENFAVVERFSAVYPNTKIKIDNDVKVAAYAEYRILNLNPEDMFGYITVSTGIAATNIINNQILRGSGFSGEIGFVPVPSSTGLKAVERVAAGPAIEANGRKIYRDETLTTADIFEKWQNCEWEATQVIEQSVIGIALAMYSMICLLDPKVIVLGGSVAVKNEKFVERLKSELTNIAHKEQYHILENIKVSNLDGHNGIIGAGFLVM